MVRQMKEVLQLLGWGDGFRIPMANEANKKLEQKVEELLKKKAETMVKLEVLNEKSEAMKKNVKAVAFEQEYNQKLLNGLAKQLDSDIKLMKEKELSNTKRASEMRDMYKDLKQIEDKIEKSKADVNNNTNKMNSLKESLQWGEDALFAWEEELAKGERETDLLMSFKLQDEDRFQKLDLERKQVEDELIDARGLEKREADRYKVLILQLENVSKLYREAYNERERLMRVWHDSVDICHNREEEIKRLNELICEIKNKARSKCSDIYEQKNFHEELKQMNNSIKGEATKYQIQHKKLKDLADEMENSINIYQNEKDLKKKTVGNVSGRIENERMKNAELQAKNKSRLIKYNKIIATISNIQQQYDVLKVDNLTNEQKFRNAQDMYEMSCKASEEEVREIERLYVLSTQLRQDINKLKEQENLKKRSLDLAKKMEKDLQIKCDSINDELDLIENALLIAVAEEAILRHKISELQDKCSGKDEKEELEAEVKELELRESALRKEHIQLTMRLKSLQSEYKEKITKLRNDENEIKKIMEDYDMKKKYLQADKKSVEELKDDINKYRLHLNLLMMKEHGIKENISRDDSTVSKLERQHLILEAAMRERQLEIEAQKESLVVKKRTLLEEKAMLGRTVEHLRLRIKQIQSKYSLALDLIEKDDSGKQLSIAHFKVKLAQEKYDLQMQGDDLEAKINKTEKEILAMENTLKLLNGANENYKVNLETFDKDDTQIMAKDRMEMKYTDLKKILKEDTDLLSSVKNDIEVLLDDISKVKCIAKELEDDWKTKEKEVTALEKDLASKQQKLQRASTILMKLMREVRKIKEPPTYRKLAQKSIETKIQDERNKSVLQQLAELSMNYVETKPIVNRYLAEHGLQLPHKFSTYRSTASSYGLDTARSKASMRSDSSVPSVVNLDPSQLLGNQDTSKRKENKYLF